MRWTKGRYAFIVATHTDREHIHNHIIYNSTSLDATRKFRDFYFSGLALGRLSNLICLEHKLSIIAPQPYSNKGKQIEYPKPLTQREQLCMDLDEVLKKKPKSFEELVRFLQEADYEYKGGKQPAFRKKGQKRFIRLRSLDPEYSKENLEAIIAGEKTHREKTYSRQKHAARPQMSLLIDIQAKLQQGKGAGYERWAKVFNLKQMAQAMVFYENHKFRDYGELEQLAAESVRKTDEMLASIKADEARLAEIKVMKTHLQNYNKAKNVFAEYKKSGYSKKYFEEHRDVLTLRKAAKQAFDEYVKEHGKDTPLPKLAELNAEYAMILERKKKTYATYRKEKEEMQDYLIAQKIAAVILREEDQQREEEHSEPEKNQR